MDKKFAFAELEKYRKISTRNYEFSFTKKKSGYSVNKHGKVIEIASATKNDLLRAYNYALGLIKNDVDQQCTYSSHFDELIGMVDLARNAVLSVNYFKQQICRLAGLGYTEIWLYLEDEFAIPEEPYFGMQRGRYSQAELHELAVYADKLGVTLVPAIQALAHLKNVFKWEHFNDIADTTDNLYVGKRKTREFVKRELIAATKPFLTNKIHLGMDEAHNLGLGRYFFDHGTIDQYGLMKQHVEMVFELCKELNLKPMMWSDMWFEIGSPTHMMYDPQANLKEFKVDPQIGQVYWDYYSTDENHYLPVMKKHFELTDNVYFAMGIWTWGRLAPNQSKMLATIKAGMIAAKKAKIRKIATTAWRDDGAETPFAASYLGWQVFSDYQYEDQPEQREFANNFKMMQDEDFTSYMLLDQFDNPRSTTNEKDMIPSKLLLYEDLMQPRYYQNLKHGDFSEYYHELTQKLSDVVPSEYSGLLFNYYIQLALVLSKKAHLMNDLVNKKYSLGELSDYRAELQDLADQRMHLWFNENKPNGSEILDIRFGGMLQRIRTVADLIERNQFQMDLPTEEMDKHINDEFGNGRYFEIVSPSDISW